MEILRIENLSFYYPEEKTPCLKDINFSVEAGETLLVCGASGSGKSTLLRLIKNELAPFGKKEGSVIYCGDEIESLEKRRSSSEIGIVLQDPENQIVTDNVINELAFGLENLGIPKEVIRRRVSEISNFFGLWDIVDKRVSELSGGQKQLLNLASVIAMNPKIILFDEPTSRLDPIASENFIKNIEKISSELGITVIIVEHRLENALSISDKVVYLKEGRVEYFGRAESFPEYFEKDSSDMMKKALPASCRIFSLLGGKGKSPLTVCGGRRFLAENIGLSDLYYKTAEDKREKSEKALELRSVFFRYEKNGKDVLKGLDFTAWKGEHYCILGGNGSGKSTALGVISGILRHYRGKVLIFEKPIEKYEKTRLYGKELSYMTQDTEAMFTENTLKKELEHVSKVYGLKNGEERITEVCNMLGIEHLLGRHPFDLSGGERQKAAFAKLLITEPKILLLDEPTNGLDVEAKEQTGNIIKMLCGSGTTVITVTHDVEFAAMYADRVGMIFDGEMVSQDSSRKFFSENYFYTTAVLRITRGFLKNTVLLSDVSELCNVDKELQVNVL